MDKFDNDKSRSFEYRKTRAIDVFKLAFQGILNFTGSVFSQTKEVCLILLGPLWYLFPFKKSFRRKSWASKRTSGEEERHEDSLSELRKNDVERTSYYRRTRFKEWVKREFNGTPKTLLVIITFPFWFPWMLIKFKK